MRVNVQASAPGRRNERPGTDPYVQNPTELAWQMVVHKVAAEISELLGHGLFVILLINLEVFGPVVDRLDGAVSHGQFG